jgi:hypothetical protein
VLKKLYVGLLDESERQGLIDSALDTGIDNVEGYALHVRSEKLSLFYRGLELGPMWYFSEP